MEPGLQEVSDLFHRYKNICYHAVNLEVRDPVLAERLVQDVMRRIAGILPLAQSCDSAHRQALLVLVSRYMARQYLRKNHLPTPAQNGYKSKAASLFVLDEDVDRYLQKISSLSPGDRLVIILHYGYGFNLKDVARVMGTRHKVVVKRLARSDRFLFFGDIKTQDRTSGKRKKSDTKKARYGDGPELKEACEIYIRNSLDVIEAISSIDSHKFDPGFEQETIRLMLADCQEDAEKHFTLQNSYGILLISVLLIVVFVILLARILTRPREVSPVESLSIEESSSQAPEEVIIEERTVKKPAYACYSQGMVFVDPETSMVYTVDQEGEVHSWGKIRKALEEGYGLQHIGYSFESQIVHLALLSGQGAEIKGDPPVLSMTPYWYGSWFDGTIDTPQEARQGIVVNQVRYIFK